MGENGTPSEGTNFSWDYDGGTRADGYSPGGVVTVGEWIHYAAVFTPGAPTKIYRLATEISYNLQNTPVGNPHATTGAHLWMGVWTDLTDYFKGDFGGFVRLWNTSRTQQELQDNMNLLLDASQETGLIINCNFSEGSGATVANQASPGNDMALTGSPAWVSGPATTDKSYGVRVPRHGFVDFDDGGIV